MKDTCGMCGRPAVARCEEPNCSVGMCQMHIWPTIAPVLASNKPPHIAKYCLHHAHLARTQAAISPEEAARRTEGAHTTPVCGSASPPPPPSPPTSR